MRIGERTTVRRMGSRGSRLGALDLLLELLVVLLVRLLAVDTALDTGETGGDGAHAPAVEVHADTVGCAKGEGGVSVIEGKREGRVRKRTDDDEETNGGDDVGELGRLVVRESALHRGEDGSTGDTHAEETGTALRVLAEVRGGEGEDGRVDDRLAEEDDEAAREGGGLGGESGDEETEEGANRSVDGDGDGGVEEADDRDRDEARNHEDDLHCEVERG